MKKLLIIFLSLFSINAFSQDLIVTEQSDSINCKIKIIRDGYIHFVFKDQNLNKIRTSLLNEKQVKTYEYNFYKNSYIGEESDHLKKKFRLKADFGGGYMLGDVEEESSAVQEHSEKLNSGFDYDLSFSYFLKPIFKIDVGIGLKCSYFNSQNTLKDISGSIGNYNFAGDFDSEINTYFIAPQWLMKTGNSFSKSKFLFGIAIGYAYHEKIDKVDEDNLRVKQSGSNLGTYTYIAWDYMLGESIALGVTLSLTSVVFRELNIDINGNKSTIESPDGELFSAARVSLGVGLRLYK